MGAHRRTASLWTNRGRAVRGSSTLRRLASSPVLRSPESHRARRRASAGMDVDLPGPRARPRPFAARRRRAPDLSHTSSYANAAPVGKTSPACSGLSEGLEAPERRLSRLARECSVQRGHASRWVSRGNAVSKRCSRTFALVVLREPAFAYEPPFSRWPRLVAKESATRHQSRVAVDRLQPGHRLSLRRAQAMRSHPTQSGRGRAIPALEVVGVAGVEPATLSLSS